MTLLHTAIENKFFQNPLSTEKHVFYLWERVGQARHLQFRESIPYVCIIGEMQGRVSREKIILFGIFFFSVAVCGKGLDARSEVLPVQPDSKPRNHTTSDCSPFCKEDKTITT